ncbi:DEAD/DEAH box helicase [Streptomyces albidoflavus]|uniref:DEAD/DEAH box helicase n=2 Tax=Streptomyces TaxID=1883 RepID=UPI000775C1CD|nr:DEAD/DEAH box helicase [Streptomyces albidoflavus]
MQMCPAFSPADVRALSACATVFVPGDPARAGSLAFFPAEGSGPPEVPGAAPGELSLVLPDEDGSLRVRPVRATLLSVAWALPVLTRARVRDDAHPSAAFWGAAALLALDLLARGLLLPGLSPADHDAWRCGPLGPDELGRVRELAASMPPVAHCGPVAAPPGSDAAELALAEPERLLRHFLDAVADTLPRTAAAPALAGSDAYTAGPPQHLPGQRGWAADVAAGHDAGVRLSLRVETPAGAGGEESGTEVVGAFRAVLQLHSLSDPGRVADAAEVWTGAGADDGAFGPRARVDALLALRRAAGVWAPLSPLLAAGVPDTVELADEEIAELLGEGQKALAGAGVEVHWPRELARELTARGVVGRDGEAGGDDTGAGFLSADSLLTFSWRFSLGGRGLTREELDVLAEAKRPLVRLRDQWVLIDPAQAGRARDRRDHTLAPMEAVGAALTGSADVGGERVEVRASGALEELRARIADPHRAEPVPVPEGLAATLRDYQQRGLSWLAGMTSLGLGACLADDMGLGKTVTLIALHLHRQAHPATTGPTLVVCPASLMGNWQREIERFAPGTPVRRYHGASRASAGLPAEGFVLTTYGTMRLDAAALAGAGWGMVVADEAQHVKNPYSSTARQLRAIPAKARVALTGTPVENNLSELWAVLDWTTPGLLGRLGTFRRVYARAVESGDDPAAARRLARLVGPFLLRRRKSDPGIAPELPPKTETDHAVGLTAEQTGLYEAVVRETLAAVAAADGMERRGLIVQLLTSLKQICNHPAQYLKEDRPRVGGRSGKVELLDELLDTILAEGAGVLLFTQYVRMGRLLERHLAARGVATQFLHGQTPIPAREEMVRRFQDGEVPVFLLSLKAAGTGLNLTRAEHVVHVDRWWNPAVEAQATDRAYRIGQTRPVQVHRIVTEGTIEDRIAELLVRKQALADAVLTGGEAALTELSDAELAELVTLRTAAR